MNNCYCEEQMDYGVSPYVTNVKKKSVYNDNFRVTLWTGRHFQMTLMCIPVCSDIGLEVHKDTDQLIRIEQGRALVKMGNDKCELNFHQNVCEGDAIFVPAGTWHNVINIGSMPLKVSSIYAPPHHPAGTIHHAKEDAQREHYE